MCVSMSRGGVVSITLWNARLCKHEYSDLWMLLILQHNKTNNRQKGKNKNLGSTTL